MFNRLALAVGLAMTSVPSAALASAVDSAFKLCAMIDATGLTSKECEVSGWRSTVTTVIDMDSGEARDLCAKLAAHTASQGMGFAGKWTLEIKSPYSGDNPIAFCKLR